MDFYGDKQGSYFTNPRFDLIKLIPDSPTQRILEVGAGGGDTLVEIKNRNLAAEVVGVDLVHIPNSHQTNQLIDKFIVCNVEQDALPFEAGYFDVILLGDVVEHLFDPWAFMQKMTRVLKKGGIIVASLPNFRHYSTLYRIYFKGDFRYENQGLFDKTHFRFFCKKNMIQLFNTEALKLTLITPRNTLLGLKGKKELLNKLTFRRFEEFLTVQYIIVSKKS